MNRKNAPSPASFPWVLVSSRLYLMQRRREKKKKTPSYAALSLSGGCRSLVMQWVFLKVSASLTSSSPPGTRLKPLRKHVPQSRVVQVDVAVIHTNVSNVCSLAWRSDPQHEQRLPLQVIRARIFVFSLRTKRADVSRRPVNQPMSNHFIFPLESLPTFRTRA